MSSFSVLGMDAAQLTDADQQFLISYYDTLASLKIPQKPSINMLTILADEHRSAHSAHLVQLIINYINNTIPRNRMPALYLIDSICKNLRKEYITLFSTHIGAVFTTTYDQCDAGTQKQLLHLYNTWIKQNVFNNTVLEPITKHLRQLGALTTSAVLNDKRAANSIPDSTDPKKPRLISPQPPATLPIIPPHISKPSPQPAVQPAVPAPQQTGMLPTQAAFNAQQQFNMMQAAQRMAQQQAAAQYHAMAQMPMMQQQQMMQQLPPQFRPQPSPQLPMQPFIPPHMMQPPPPHMQGQAATNANKQQFDQYILQISAELAARPDLRPLVAHVRHMLLQPNNTLASAVQAVTNALQTKTAAPPVPAVAPVPAVQQQQSQQQVIPPPTPPTPAKLFTQSDAFKQRDEYVVWQLYFQFTIQCSICGIRTPNTDVMTGHLDYHFKINKLMIHRQGKQRNQNWYLPADEWLQHRDIIFDTTKPVDDASARHAQYDSVHGASSDTVVHRVPVDETQKICPVCHDKFEQIFDDSTEQWMYENTIRVECDTMMDLYNDTELTQAELVKKNKRIQVNQQYDGQILHYNCYDSMCLVAATTAANNNVADAGDVPELERVELTDEVE